MTYIEIMNHILIRHPLGVDSACAFNSQCEVEVIWIWGGVRCRINVSATEISIRRERFTGKHGVFETLVDTSINVHSKHEIRRIDAALDLLFTDKNDGKLIDLDIAIRRLAEIKKFPEQVVRGESLDAKLDQWGKTE